MSPEKIIAGIFSGTAALLLIYLGYITEGGMLATGMLGFFVGDANGARRVEAAQQ